MPRLLPALMIGLLWFAASGEPARAADPMPPKQVIERFYDGLLGVMKDATKLGYKGRYEKLEPLLKQTYNLAGMGRFTVGPGWTQMSPEERTRLVDGFGRLTIATYANRFDGYSGEKFEVVGETPAQSGSMIVETKLVTSTETIQLNYLMTKVGEEWRVFDVYLEGTISELAVRRSEFSAILRRDGAEALFKALDQKVAALVTK